MPLFRGTQSPDVKGYLKTPSWTPSLPVAAIWSARPGEVFMRREASFLPGSTLHVGELRTSKILDMGDYPQSSFREILKLLRFGEPGGRTEETAMSILNYLHKRIIGRAPGGDFAYKVLDDDGEELDPNDVPLSLLHPITLVSEFRDEFEDHEDPMDKAGYLEADTFIFADAPAFQKAALDLGYEALHYTDIFAGGSYVSDMLLGIPVTQLQGVEMDEDIDGEMVPVHDTYRPLTPNAIVEVEAHPTEAFLKSVPPETLQSPR